MRSGASLKLLSGIATVLIVMLSTSVSAQQQTSDKELSETLTWMDNSYNPHPNVSGAYGHGHTGWYAPKSGGRPHEEVLASGSTETFTYNGCQMTLHIEDDRAAETSKEVYVSFSYSFNLRDVNPQSIRMGTISHTGGFYCEAFPGADMDCDHAEIVFKTRLEAPLIDEYSDAIYPKLQGSDHEWKGSSKANTAHFMVNDVEYAKRLMRAFHHAVDLCGGKPGPF
jgi:hypothetical protein